MRGLTDALYEMMIGLEVHVELLTESKMFCRCPVRFGDPPNTNVCPVCMGLPGALPVPNEKAVELGLRAAIGLNAQINLDSSWDRKNYFYPDLTKGYQITQYEKPLAENGCIEIDEPRKAIRVRRIHLEEDTGKSIHAGDDITSASFSLLDFNRSGVPLIEIVSEPDMNSPEEARQYLERLQRILSFAGVSDVKMEEGSMRVDCNISVRPKGADTQGTPVQLKNLNSYRAVVKALGYEFRRQVEAQKAVNGLYARPGIGMNPGKHLFHAHQRVQSGLPVLPGTRSSEVDSGAIRSRRRERGCRGCLERLSRTISPGLASAV